MKKNLTSDFFNRPAPLVARELLGKFLVRKIGSKTVALMITETEAYHGFDDQASHARRGQTPRNAPMFGEPRTIYVYFTYGMHWMLNVVCGKKEFPAAVLIRAVAPNKLFLYSQEYQNSFSETELLKLNGPAKLTKFLQIDKKLNGKKLGKVNGLWIEDRGVKILPKQIKKTPRIGVPNRGVWTAKPWRFVLKEK